MRINTNSRITEYLVKPTAYGFLALILQFNKTGHSINTE